MDEVYENGPIRIAKVKRGEGYVYCLTLEDFSQMVLTQEAFDSLKELMVAFADEEFLEDDIEALIRQEQFDFTIQEGEYG